MLVIATLPYVNAIPNGFVLDDELIEKDPRIHALSVGRIFSTGYWDTVNRDPRGDVYRPLAVLSYAINYRLSGQWPAAFHAVNIVLHAVTSVLVLAFVHALLGDRWIAFAAALLFAAHPVHTEAVTSVVGRAEIQSALFLLIALILHVRHYALPGLRPGVWLAVAVVSFALALLSKETAVAGPALVVLVGLVDPTAGRSRGLQRAFRVAVLYLLVVGGYLAARIAVLGTATVGSNGQPGLLYGEPLLVRALTGLHLLLLYGKLLVWPVVLSADYSFRQIEIDRTAGVMQLGGLTCVAGLAGGFVWAVRHGVRPVVGLRSASSRSPT